VAQAFFDELVVVVPYRVHTVLTDNGIQFADRPRIGMVPPPDGAATPSTGPASGIASRIV